jgi:hypothetical protein
MPVITVPFDYDEKRDCNVVPIAVSVPDVSLSSSLFQWVERGVVPVADPLRSLARRVLGDVWRVSEMTDHVIHSLERRNGFDLGDAPELRVLKSARWYAEDVRAGGRRVRRKMDVELFDETLDTIQDQADLVRHLEVQDALGRLLEELDRLGLDDVREMVPMMLLDCDAEEFRERFGKSRNTLSQRFYRGARKAAIIAGLMPKMAPKECR